MGERGPRWRCRLAGTKGDPIPWPQGGHRRLETPGYKGPIRRPRTQGPKADTGLQGLPGMTGSPGLRDRRETQTALASMSISGDAGWFAAVLLLCAGRHQRSGFRRRERNLIRRWF